MRRLHCTCVDLQNGTAFGVMTGRISVSIEIDV